MKLDESEIIPNSLKKRHFNQKRHGEFIKITKFLVKKVGFGLRNGIIPLDCARLMKNKIKWLRKEDRLLEH